MTEGFYSDQTITALTTSYVFFRFGHASEVFTLTNDDASGANIIQFSFDGVNLHGQIPANQGLTWDRTQINGIWLQSGMTAPAYRVMSTYKRG